MSVNTCVSIGWFLTIDNANFPLLPPSCGCDRTPPKSRGPYCPHCGKEITQDRDYSACGRWEGDGYRTSSDKKIIFRFALGRHWKPSQYDSYRQFKAIEITPIPLLDEEEQGIVSKLQELGGVLEFGCFIGFDY